MSDSFFYVYRSIVLALKMFYSNVIKTCNLYLKLSKTLNIIQLLPILIPSFFIFILKIHKLYREKLT